MTLDSFDEAWLNCPYKVRVVGPDGQTAELLGYEEQPDGRAIGAYLAEKWGEGFVVVMDWAI
jgi:hypothetical protein